MRHLTIDDIKWRVEVQDEHEPVRGNALASGDDDTDRQCEDEIIARLERGDIWAWCCARVVGEWEDIEADGYLGCCSYVDEVDFRAPGGYFDDMQSEIRDEIQARAERIAEAMSL